MKEDKLSSYGLGNSRYDTVPGEKTNCNPGALGLERVLGILDDKISGDVAPVEGSSISISPTQVVSGSLARWRTTEEGQNAIANR